MLNKIKYAKLQKKMIEWAGQGEAGLQKLSAMANAVIDDYVEARVITPLILQIDPLTGMGVPSYDVIENIKAFFISVGAGAIQNPVDSRIINPEIFRLHSNPVMDIGVLSSGHAGKLSDKIKGAANAIVDEENSFVLDLVSTALSALGASNTVTVSGGSLTTDAVDEAIALIEDQGKRCTAIFTRGQHLSKFKNDFSPKFNDDLMLRGARGSYNGATLFNIPQLAEDTVIFIPETIGFNPIRTAMATETERHKFEISVLSYKEEGFALTRAKYASQVKITA